MLCDVRNVNCTIKSKLRIYSDQLMKNNEKLNIRANISQRKSGFCTQIIIFLKPPLLYGG